MPNSATKFATSASQSSRPEPTYRRASALIVLGFLFWRRLRLCFFATHNPLVEGSSPSRPTHSGYSAAMSSRLHFAFVLITGCVMSSTLLAAEQPLPPPGAAAAEPRSNASASTPAAKAASDRCYTSAANCILSDPKRKGSECWCATPFGPSYGRVK
jgi:hypothetical protein